MSKPLRGFAFTIVLAAPVAGACGDDTPPSFLQPADLAVGKSGPAVGSGDVGDDAPAPVQKFDKNNIVDPGSMTDSDTVDVTAVQGFLAKNPYGVGQTSFLLTYQSNGVRAADAIVNVARKYDLNPLIFLVYAQATQGLIGTTRYPFPPERVEYVFGCGVLGPHNFDPALAGFDRQLDCLGHALRAGLDAIKGTSQTTDAGWGPNVRMVSLDGVQVTPGSAETAAIYDHTPRVNVGKVGGTWLLWNLWQHYAAALSYSPPAGSSDGKWLGDACTTPEQCSPDLGETVFCATAGYPGGACIVECSKDKACPVADNKAEGFCTSFSGGGFCLPICNRSVASSCRAGYQCKGTTGVEGDQQDVCLPVGATQ